MGYIRETKLDNGNIGLEITYGGKEAPFGGVDTSAPPAYIDPKCFAFSDGFIVVDNKLVATSLFPLQTPLLWSGVSGIILLAYGNFYETGFGQLNYALGYIGSAFGTVGVNPTGVNYTFYMTTWSPNTPSTVLSNTQIELTLFDSYLPATQASIILPCIGTGAQSNPVASSATINILAVQDFPPTYGWLSQNSDLSITGGVGYSVGQFITIVQGSNYGAVVQVTSVSGGGAITGFNITGPASGYTVGAASSVIYVNTPTVLVINGPAGGPNTYSVGSSTWTTLTAQAVVTAMITAINGGPDPNVVATASQDGLSVILTAIQPGTAGNSITVQDTSSDYSSVLPPIFYFACRTADNLTGGQNLRSVIAPRSFDIASVAEVGGTLYIGNIGPIILKYTEPAILTISSMYSGVAVLRKFAGSLLGARLQPQLGTLIQNTDCVIAWSSPNNLDEWAPATTSGLVTGAGFEQLADIGDYLSGLIVSNGTVYIIRSQGLSYATATGSASLPFAVSHIGLGDVGEGCQVTDLIAQYNETGVYVGNSNIFQVSGSISAIGEKIKALFYSILVNGLAFPYGVVPSSALCAVQIGGDVFPLAVFEPGAILSRGSEALHLFCYNVTNGTWNILTFPPLLNSGITRPQLIRSMLSPMAQFNTLAASEEFNQNFMTVAVQLGALTNIGQPPVPVAPVFYIFQEGIPNTNSISNSPIITFPEEEILFGRDVTVDSLYIALVANVSENTTLNFYINAVLYATFVLTSAQFNSLTANPTELQIFPLASYGAGADTGHSPQLSVQVVPITDTGTAQIRFTKIMMMASFDPAQRPT